MEGGNPLDPLNLASGLIAAVSGLAFAAQVHFEKLKINVVAWGMILIIDLVGLVLTYAAGNDRPYLQWGWTIPVAIIVVIGLRRGAWEWTQVETDATICCILSVLWWLMSESMWSLLGYVIACFASCAPQVKIYWDDIFEARKAAWVWLVNSLAIILTLSAIPNFELQYSLIPVGLLVLNLIVSAITVIKWRP